ncbi:MAG: outer membrane beta-barrel protein [Flavobacteriia bacterium]|nr:outer membrane beta-barrel protein [Flavobacteriia bacterium]
MVFSNLLLSQKELTKNYKRFDERVLHFGFMLGVNKSSFDVYTETDVYKNYGLTSLMSKSTPGGQVGIVATMKLKTPIVRLRFIPTLSFQEKVLIYNYVNPDPLVLTPIVKEQRVNSTNLDFPIMLQFRTHRLNNFAAYCLIGMQPTIDLQSQQYATQSSVAPFLKIYKKDFQGQVGGGLEFFAPYFKFGIELKYSQSFENNMIQDNTPVSLPIHSLYNKGWWLSFIFEG